ncbi:hypothetical protein LAZ67_14002895 [Cordylochernes scorpioides]|uniref:Integrase catalytic domain-containing protein n=1 Tax=Cordylochernes scorpioides TaxID=51811 RepID=A0ABY6L789_9ARAC|nr:hypothetical protein LAZ67_14002895 [Cordylochernes scorpioides]
MPGHRKRRQFKQTDAFTRGMVIGLKRAGWSILQIAADTHLGASTVHRLWIRWLEQGNVAIYRNVGATRVTSARVDRRILRQAVAAPQATCTAILQHVQDTLDHSISTRTISRRLVANGLHSCRPLRRLPLTPPNRRQRLEWCRARSTWMTEWHRVVFSDESRFCLSIDSRRVRVWRRRGERSNPAAIVERPTVRQHASLATVPPDLSPIEHVWDIIGRRLHALPQPRSEDELWQMVEREWRAIPQDAIRTLIDSLPRRVAACIAIKVELGANDGELEDFLLVYMMDGMELRYDRSLTLGYHSYSESRQDDHNEGDHNEEVKKPVQIEATKSKDGGTIPPTIKLYYNKDLQKRLLSDRAPAFTSEKFRKFLITHGIQPLLTTSNSPQANGLIERLNATITGKLRLAYLENSKASGTQLVKRITQTYNNTPHSVTNFPPTYLMFNVVSPDLRTHLNPYPEITRARKIARSRTQNKHKKDKETFDKQHRTPHFEVNDLVLVKNYRHPNTGKLAPYFTGPYTIIEIISPNVVRIDRPNQPLNRNSDTIHVNKLKYYTENVLYITPPQTRFVQNPQRMSRDVYLNEFNHLTPDIFETQLFRIIPPQTSQPFLHLNPDLFNIDSFKTNLKESSEADGHKRHEGIEVELDVQEVVVVDGAVEHHGEVEAILQCWKQWRGRTAIYITSPTASVPGLAKVLQHQLNARDYCHEVELEAI